MSSNIHLKGKVKERIRWSRIEAETQSNTREAQWRRGKDGGEMGVLFTILVRRTCTQQYLYRQRRSHAAIKYPSCCNWDQAQTNMNKMLTNKQKNNHSTQNLLLKLIPLQEAIKSPWGHPKHNTQWIQAPCSPHPAGREVLGGEHSHHQQMLYSHSPRRGVKG